MKLRLRIPSTTRHRQPRNRNGDVIGLDLGATSVRAAILRLRSEGGRASVDLRALGSVALPPGAVVNGAVTDRAEVTEAVRELWALNGFTSRRVILGMANPQVVVRPLQIPDLTAQQRVKALPFQAREIIALPLDEVVLDYAQVGVPDPETGMVPGLLIATPRLPVLAAVESVERAGLTVARVDLSSFGALRSIADEHLVVQAVIDIGAQLTSIVIHDHGVPKLVRTLARGGQELTDLLVADLQLSPAEAEQVKCQVGLTDHRLTDHPLTDHHLARPGLAAAAEALRSGIRPLLAEIRSSINYFRAGSDGGRLEGIALTGGGSALPGLAAELSSQNGVPTRLISPLHHLDRRPDQAGDPRGATVLDPTAGAVSIGLAMGAAA